MNETTTWKQIEIAAAAEAASEIPIKITLPSRDWRSVMALSVATNHSAEYLLTCWVRQGAGGLAATWNRFTKSPSWQLLRADDRQQVASVIVERGVA